MQSENTHKMKIWRRGQKDYLTQVKIITIKNIMIAVVAEMKVILIGAQYNLEK